MAYDFDDRVRSLSVPKALAVGLYGESVASYRYRVLAEAIAPGATRAALLQMADEEQDHHALLQRQLDEHFPDSDFVLSPEDKELIIVGPRLLDVAGSLSLAEAMDLIHASEMQTGRFYASLHDCTDRDDLKPLLKEMAEECFKHAGRLREIKLD